jgi:hypothetical protein
MNSSDFYKYVDDTDLLSSETLSDIEKLFNEFPYFVGVKMIYFQNLLKVKDDISYYKIKSKIIYMPDKRKIFMLVESICADYVNERKSQKKVVDFKKIDAFLSSKGKMNEVNNLLEMKIVSDYFNLIEKDSVAENIPEWKELDSFMADAGRMERLREKIKNNLMTNEEIHLSEWKSSETESLAQVYIQQRKYEQALEIFRKLRLKYPEKEDYFVTRIRDLEKLVEPAKNEIRKQ